MHSIPNNGLHYSNDRTNHGVRVLFLAESHCDTPPQLLGKQLYLTQFSDEMERSICETIPPGIFHGHINLVHCLSYGESWLLNQDDVSKLSKAEQQSVSRGTDQFWRVMAIFAGDCDVHDLPSGKYDPLAEENYDMTFAHVIGSEKTDKA